MQQIPACFIKPYGKLWGVCHSSSGFIPHYPTVVHSCGVPFNRLHVKFVFSLSLLWVVFTESYLTYVCTLGLCEVVVAGNWECEIAYLETDSLAWIAEGDSKHVLFLPAVLSLWSFLLVLESYFYQYKLSCFSNSQISFFPQDKRFRVTHCWLDL